MNPELLDYQARLVKARMDSRELWVPVMTESTEVALKDQGYTLRRCSGKGMIKGVPVQTNYIVITWEDIRNHTNGETKV